jgi:hypothetical protein
MQAAMAISAAAAQATAPGTALNPYQVEVRHYNYPAYRCPYYRSYYNY